MFNAHAIEDVTDRNSVTFAKSCRS